VGLRSPIDPEHVTPMTDRGSGRPATKLTALSLLRFIDSCHFTDTDDDTAQKRRYSAGRSWVPLPWALERRNGSSFTEADASPGSPVSSGGELGSGCCWKRSTMRWTTGTHLFVGSWLLLTFAGPTDRRSVWRYSYRSIVERPNTSTPAATSESWHLESERARELAFQLPSFALSCRKICNDFAELSTRSKCTRIEAHSFTLPKSPAPQGWNGVSYVNENILDLLIRLDSLINRKCS